MLCAYMYLGHASPTTIRGDFGHEFTDGKFPNPPKFIVDLPQSVLECGFNAQLRKKLTIVCAHAMEMRRRLPPPTFSP